MKPSKALEHRRHVHARPAARVAAQHHARRHHGSMWPVVEDRHVGRVRTLGTREIGTASWYGGRHLGRRTASGKRLDAVHATAAHRTLPLHSLVRVTNLSNGRSCIAVVTDRGPVSRRLLIDLSPRAADELNMKAAGVVPVAVEPVAVEPASEPADASR